MPIAFLPSRMTPLFPPPSCFDANGEKLHEIYSVVKVCLPPPSNKKHATIGKKKESLVKKEIILVKEHW